MKTISNTFTIDELLLLNRHIGSKLDSVAGNDVPDYLTSTEFLVRTSHGVLRLWGDSIPLDFRSFADDYSTWRIDEEPVGIQEATSRGEPYHPHLGEDILGVDVVRDITQEISNGKTNWEYTTDVALVFTLSGGALLIERTDLNIELLTARFFAEGDEVKVHHPDAYWHDTDGTHYEVGRVVQ